MNQLNNTFKIMRENCIIHRDLNLGNILIKYNDNKEYIIKLAGYGVSERLNSFTEFCSETIGNLWYMAPEILKGNDYDYKCDLWSIGIIMYKLCYGKFPYLSIFSINCLSIISEYGDSTNNNLYIIIPILHKSNL